MSHYYATYPVITLLYRYVVKLQLQLQLSAPRSQEEIEIPRESQVLLQLA
jgi:hypothetical protein